MHNQIFNVGDTQANYRVKQIAEIVADAFPGCGLTFGNSDGDNRSYRVSFDKIHAQLPGFRCRHDAAFGAAQFHALFERLKMPRETFEFRSFTRLKQLKYLLETQQIDSKFFWH